MPLARKDLVDVMLPYYVYGWSKVSARRVAALLIARVADISMDEARATILGKIVPTDCNASFIFFVTLICDGIKPEPKPPAQPEEPWKLSMLTLYAHKVIGYKPSITLFTGGA